MSLVINNPRIYAFYEKHPKFDFEKMNIMLVDLLENFQESLNPSLDSNFASKLYLQMESLQMDLKNQLAQQQLESIKQLNEVKKQYIEDVKSTIQYNHASNVLPILSQQTDKFQEKMMDVQKNDVIWQTHSESVKRNIQQELETLSRKTVQPEQLHEFTRTIEERITSLVSASEGRLQDQLRNNRSSINDLTKVANGQEQMNVQVGELLRKMDNSSSKGKVSETVLGHVIHSLYPMGEINSVGTIKETGDIMMSREGKPTILFENKNYDRNVGHDEVQKFLRDVETQKCSGILLAQNYGIANRENYEIHIYQGQICIYLHSVQYSPEKIKAAVDIIDHLSKYIDEESLQTGGDVSLDFELLEQINKEYQQFVQQKLAQIKTVKDYSQKLIAQVEDMKLPQLDRFLGKHFSTSLSSKENQCRYCGFEAKSSGGLVSHMRACKKRPEADHSASGPTKPTKPSSIQIVRDE